MKNKLSTQEAIQNVFSGHISPKLQKELENPKEAIGQDKAQTRKSTPVFSGVLAYFPNALMEVAHISYVGSQQHNPDKPMFWDKTKSKDNADALLRHLTDYAKGIELDEDGLRHLGKVAWRALALLEASIETVEK